ncbi:hypothetical protein FUT79_09545 [Treponema phagedenis]|uniref:Uncharacterized protein n=1 Tax=Treponema phagedenis TaxID=162 RepID=A0A0B7GUN4_TREPH|nr:hypothetical protein FUT79_09545 [Treponema phagedenis]CEM60401.1 conserved hypothetical protein [Treponema phagedenis]
MKFSKGELSWNRYLWFAYEFYLFTLEYQVKHRLKFSKGEQFTTGMLESVSVLLIRCRVALR